MGASRRIPSPITLPACRVRRRVGPPDVRRIGWVRSAGPAGGGIRDLTDRADHSATFYVIMVGANDTTSGIARVFRVKRGEGGQPMNRPIDVSIPIVLAQASSDRRSYEPPVLTAYGDVRDLTLGPSGTTVESGGGFFTPAHSDIAPLNKLDW